MREKCDYCGGYLPDTAEYCPNCGAANPHLARNAAGVPQTVEELKAFCAARKMPLKKMRFFIGDDCREAKAFGIYKDADGCFVVYKNKADGSRAVRYRGADEAYAVNELYQKLSSEVRLRRNKVPPTGAKTTRQNEKLSQDGMTVMVIFLIILAMFVIMCLSVDMKSDGYYCYDDDYYYYQNGTWFSYDESDGWDYAETVDEDLTDNAYSYWQGSGYQSNFDAGDFSESEYYTVTDDSD